MTTVHRKDAPNTPAADDSVDSLIESLREAPPWPATAGMSRFAAIALPLARLGYCAIPCVPGSKEPLRKFAHRTEWSTDQIRADYIGVDGRKGWLQTYAEADGLWHLDAMPGGVDLDVIDVDDMSQLAWAIETFGVTPLVQHSGREGGGRHLFYRRDESRPRDERGSTNRVAGRKVDFKSWHGYVVAPGSVHKSGAVYRLYWQGAPIATTDLTLDMIMSLPVLDRGGLDRLVGAPKSGKVAELEPAEPIFDLGFGDGKVAPKTGSGVTADPEATIPNGPWGGRTVASVAAEVGNGQTRVCCPYDEGGGHSTEANGHGAAALWAEGGFATHLHCSACSRTYVFRHRVECVQWVPENKIQGSTGHRVPATGVRHVVLTENDVLPSGHLSAKKLAMRTGMTDTLVIQAGVGVGKTEVAKELAAISRKRRGLPTIAVSPTRTLSRALSKRLGLPCYLDLPDTGDLPVDGAGLAVCTPSLHRVEMHSIIERHVAPKIGLLILDEIEQQLRALGGRHLSDTQARDAWGALLYAVRHAEEVILLDAHAGVLTARLIQMAGRWDRTVWVTGSPGAARPVKTYQRRGQLELALMDHWMGGGRPYVVVQSVKGAEALARQLKSKRPGTRVICLTKETVGEYDLTRINEWAGECDALVCTPVVGTGISIDVRDHFSVVFAATYDGQGTWQDLEQQVSRVRHPKDLTIHLHAHHAGKRPEPWEADPGAVYDRWVRLGDRTAQLTGVDYVDAPGIPYRRVLHDGAELYVRMLADVHASDVKHGRGRVAEAFVEAMDARGGDHIPDPDCTPPSDREKQVKSEIKALREQVKAEAHEAILSAAPIDEDEAKRIRRSGARSIDEARSYQRHAIEKFAGEVDIEKVETDDEGRGRSRARTLAHTVAMAEGGQAAESVREMDRSEVKRGVSPARLSHREVMSRLYLMILGWVGIRLEHLRVGGWCPVDSGGEDQGSTGHGVQWKLEAVHLETLRAKLAQPSVRATLGLLGISVATDWEKRPLRLISTVLGRMGLSLKATSRKGGRKERFRSYVIDAESHERIARFGQRYWTALHSDGVQWGDEDVVDLTPISHSGHGVSEADLGRMLDEILAA